MAFNDRKYEDKSVEHRFKSKDYGIKVIIETKSDKVNTFFNVKAEVTLPHTNKTRSAQKSGMVYSGDNRDIRTNIWINRVPDHSKFCVSVDFNVDTLEVSDAYCSMN